jgi:ribosome maturation factor RimP
MAEDLKARLTGLLASESETRGFEIVLLEVAGTRRNPLVRVFLDHEGGITIDQIAEANRWIKEALETLPQMENGYTLEVSSPGIDRPLVKLADFERFAGSRAKVSVSPEVEGHKHFTGTIRSVEGAEIVLDVDGTAVRVPHSSVSRANLRAEIDFSKEGTAEDGV